MKRTIAIILTLCALLSLAACGGGEESAAAPEAAQSAETPQVQTSQSEAQARSSRSTEEGWLMTEIELPCKMPALSGHDNDGDWLWIFGRSEVDGEWRLMLLGYDTLSGEWRQFKLGHAELGISEEYDLSSASALWLTVKDGMAWMRVECDSADRSLETSRLVTVDTATGQTSSAEWASEKIFQSDDQYTVAFAALGRDSALVVSSSEACIIDSSLNVLARKSIEAYNVDGSRELGGQLYLTSYDGITVFDTGTLSLGGSLSLAQGLEAISMADSELGNILYSCGGKLYSADASGSSNLVFDWMDVAMSQDTVAPDMFENSVGEYYGCAISRGLKLVKVAKAQIPVKDSLTMACFFDTESANGQTRMTSDMTDAILAYNNSAADYRIEPVYFEYAGSNDLSRALIEAFSSDIDLVDQSNLPEGTISGAQLVDMLPYLDADAELSREDFFPAALSGMSWGGHMYRVSPYYSAMGLSVPAGLYSEGGEWSCEYLQQAIASDPLLAIGMGKNRGQSYVVGAMAHAITAEFIDLESLSCDFTRPDFAEWLALMTSLIGDTGAAEDRIGFVCGIESEYSMKALYASYGFDAGDSGQISGFPNSRGSGYYLASPAAVVAIEGEYKGMNTSLSIADGCKDPQAAWEFVKLLLSKADRGIPVLKSAFEELVDYYSQAYDMAQEDIDTLRYIAENAAGTVLADPALIELITGELNAYVSGDKTAQAVAEQLQSRVGIYLSEQG